MDYLNDGYVLAGGFILEDCIKLQFGKVVDGVYTLLTVRYSRDHPEYTWAAQQLQD